MNFEPIDTSVTEGKAEVMRLAASGRKVAQRTFPNETWIYQSCPHWNWSTVDYAIIIDPIGPDELFVVMGDDGKPSAVCESLERVKTYGLEFVIYRRAN